MSTKPSIFKFLGFRAFIFGSSKLRIIIFRVFDFFLIQNPPQNKRSLFINFFWKSYVDLDMVTFGPINLN